VAFVRQRPMALKEDTRFFANESETHELLRIKARRVIDYTLDLAGDQEKRVDRRLGIALAIALDAPQNR
jgi:hypothetical protein